MPSKRRKLEIKVGDIRVVFEPEFVEIIIAVVNHVFDRPALLQALNERVMSCKKCVFGREILRLVKSGVHERVHCDDIGATVEPVVQCVGSVIAIVAVFGFVQELHLLVRTKSVDRVFVEICLNWVFSSYFFARYHARCFLKD